MIQIWLSRAFMTDKVTLGIMQIAGYDRPIYTLELPWLGNRQNVSCIPTGVYRGKSYSGTKFKDVFIIEDVLGRAGILIHAGNTVKDIQGCILPGLSAGYLAGLPAVLESRPALDELRAVIGKKDFQITITQP